MEHSLGQNANCLQSEIKNLIKLAWPLLIAQVTQTMMGVSDSIMAGRYSAADMAAVAIGFGVTFPIMVFIQGLTLALSPQIARLDGARKYADMPAWVHQTLYMTLAVGLILILSKNLMPFIFDLLAMQHALKNISVDYVNFIFYAFPGFAVYQVLRNFCEGLSKTKPTMIIMFTGLLVNIPANYIFINGLFGMPELGGAGCGLATMLVIYTMALATFLYTLIDKKIKVLGLFSSLCYPNFSRMMSLIKTGLPIAFTLLAEVTLFASAALFLSSFGPITVAAHQIALNFSSLIFMLPLSIGMAVAIRISYHIGDQRHNMAPLTFKAAIIASLSTVAFTASITVLGAGYIASVYTKNAEVVALASQLFLLAAVFQFSDAIQVVGANALRGYKDNKAMLFISILAYWAVGFPVALILAFTDWLLPAMSAKGFWIGFIIGLSVAAITMTARVLYVQRVKLPVFYGDEKRLT